MISAYLDRLIYHPKACIHLKRFRGYLTTFDQDVSALTKKELSRCLKCHGYLRLRKTSDTT